MSLDRTSSIDDLKKKLIEEAKRRAREIIEEAEREAKSIVENAEKEWRDLAESEKKKIIEQAEREASRILSEARVRARLIISEAKNKVFSEIFNEVAKIIENRERIDVNTSLRKLLIESLAYVSKPARIIIDPRDRVIVEKLLYEKNLNVEIIASNNIIGGLILEDSEGKRVDNSYKTRLERAKRVLSSYITKTLWSAQS